MHVLRKVRQRENDRALTSRASVVGLGCGPRPATRSRRLVRKLDRRLRSRAAAPAATWRPAWRCHRCPLGCTSWICSVDHPLQPRYVVAVGSVGLRLRMKREAGADLMIPSRHCPAAVGGNEVATRTGAQPWEAATSRRWQERVGSNEERVGPRRCNAFPRSSFFITRSSPRVHESEDLPTAARCTARGAGRGISGGRWLVTQVPAARLPGTPRRRSATPRFSPDDAVRPRGRGRDDGR